MCANPEIWLAAGVRTPFARSDGPLSRLDAIELSVPLARCMLDQLGGAAPDFAVWGTVVPNLTWSNIAREVLMDVGAPDRSLVRACQG
jgi:acetyl-CoA C-acetyltransferase